MSDDKNRAPVITLSFANAQGKFEDDCADLVSKGYVLSSSSCNSHSNGYAIDDIWMAIFVLPSILNK